MIAEYEWLDYMKMECLKLADKWCRKLYMGRVPFSPALQVCCDTLGSWQLIMKKIKGIKVSSHMLKCLTKSSWVRWKLVQEISLKAAKQAERKAYKELMAFKWSFAETSLETFIDDLADAIAKDGNLEKASVVWQLIHWERDVVSNHHISHVMGKNRTQGIDHVTTINDQGLVVEVHSK
jgi:hypothetical protein